MNTAQDLTDTGVYRFQRLLDSACVARIVERIQRPMTPAEIEQLLEKSHDSL